jgi:ATP-dependent DNA helicase RecG
MTNSKIGNDSKKRVDVMCSTNDGFIIAEEDLRLRGPGDLDGTRQSGAVNLRLADLAQDSHIVEAARGEAFTIIDTDPELKLPENQALRRFVENEAHDNVWSKIS